MQWTLACVKNSLFFLILNILKGVANSVGFTMVPFEYMPSSSCYISSEDFHSPVNLFTRIAVTCRLLKAVRFEESTQNGRGSES